ncbi:hypothetical protein G6F22_019388 [Rhizopus arrhizus]|nr:hypothetical protein G6F22_019388 [Rhizopus arrhizus]
MRPINGGHLGRQLDAGVAQPADDLCQPQASLLQRQRAQILTVEFKQVIGEHAHRRVAQRGSAGLATLDAGLQRSEGARQLATLVPGQQLAVQYAPIGQCQRGLFDLREAPIQPLLAA